MLSYLEKYLASLGCARDKLGMVRLRSPQAWHLGSRPLISFVAFGAALVLIAPQVAQAAQADQCKDAYSGIASECKLSCSSGEIDPESGLTALLLFSGANGSCSGAKCCVQSGDALCKLVALTKNTAGACNTGCNTGQEELKNPAGLCNSSLVCCLDKVGGKAGPKCIKLTGVESECRGGIVLSDEMDATNNPAWGEYFAGSCAQTCFVKKGNALCQALGQAKVPKAGKNYGCFNSGECEENTVLTQGAGAFGETCAGGNVCCFGKPGAKKAPPAKPGTPVTLPDPLSGMNFPRLIGNIIRTFAGIAGAVALLMFVLGGIMWILSGGEQAKVQRAHQMLVNAAIGLVLIFGAYTLVSGILGALLASGSPMQTGGTEQTTPTP